MSVEGGGSGAGAWWAPSNWLSSRRSRLVALLLVAAVAITILAAQAAGSSLSYYVSAEEFAAAPEPLGDRWRIGGRVVGESVVEEAGRPVAFTIVGDQGATVEVSFREGVVPNLFGPFAFVVVEGVNDRPGHIDASSVIIKHENEFYSEEPPPGVPRAPGSETGSSGEGAGY